MKKLPIAILCVLLAGLCACEQATPETTTESTTETPTTAIGLSKVEIQTDESDPYSFIVRDRYESFFAGSVANNSSYVNERYYSRYDVDGNGIEELMFGEMQRIGIDISENYLSGEPLRYGIFITSLFTMKNGIVIEQNIWPWLMAESLLERSILNNGVIRISGGKEADPSYCYLQFENNELKCLARLSTNDDRYMHFYSEDGVEKETLLTKEAFNNLREKYEGDGQEVELDWKPLAEYGR